MSEWMPTVEELPEEEGRYLVTLRWKIGNMNGFVKVLHYGTSLFNEWKGNKFYDIYEGVAISYDDGEVLAWMPLPKPYEMDEVEDKSECVVGCDGYCEECPIGSRLRKPIQS